MFLRRFRDWKAIRPRLEFEALEPRRLLSEAPSTSAPGVALISEQAGPTPVEQSHVALESTTWIRDALSYTVADVEEFNVGAVTHANSTAKAVVDNAANGSTVGLTAFATDSSAEHIFGEPPDDDHDIAAIG